MELSGVTQLSPPEAKIALFRSPFRGRTDIYPRRFENRKTGKAGYAPACANEWVRGVCEKPRTKCAECANRRFLPVTDDVIRWHLFATDCDGKAFVAGVYPLLLDDTCFFLAVDFDKGAWRDDSAAFVQTCRGLQLSPAVSALAPDQLPQENGYMVLRFLVEDVGKELDLVLDSILRTLRSRGSVTAIPLPLIRRTSIS